MFALLPLRLLVLSAGLTLSAPSVPTPSPATSPAGDTLVTVVDLSPGQGTLSDLLKAEVAKAVKAGRTPFVEIGAEWCGQCRQLRANLGDKRMVDAFAGVYLVRLDADAWHTQLASLGFRFRAIPVFFALDTNGRATDTSFTTDPLGANTPDHVAAPLRHFFQAHLWKAPA